MGSDKDFEAAGRPLVRSRRRTESRQAGRHPPVQKGVRRRAGPPWQRISLQHPVGAACAIGRSRGAAAKASGWRVKPLFFLLLDLFGFNALFRRLNRGKIKVLLYHNITPSGRGFDFAISPEEFDAHLRYLKRHYKLL